VTPIEFFVPGVPKPAGSKRAFCLKKGGVYTGRAIVTDDCETSRDWKCDVQRAAQEKANGILSMPLALEITFYMPRPKSHYRTGKHAGTLRNDAPDFHTTKPDATKLIRGVEDALTSIIWKDDSQIAMQLVRKRYADGTPGASIRILEISKP
jgi:crossover junction endodeoxyribonuclease RusA